MDFTSILLVILNSNYWIYFILIFYVCDLKFHIIYAVSFIYIIWVLIVFPSHTFKASLFLSKENGLIITSPQTIVFSVVFLSFLTTQEWPLVRIAASIGYYLSSLCIFAIYHQGDPLYPNIFNVVVDNVGQRVGMICRLCRIVWTLRCRMWRLRPMSRRQPAGNRGVSGRWWGCPNEKSGSDSGALTSDPLLCSNIMDKEGADLKENPLESVSGSIGGNNHRRYRHWYAKGKISSRRGQSILLLLFPHLVSGDGAGATVDVGWRGWDKGKSP